MQSQLTEGQMLPAIVVDERNSEGASMISRDGRGIQRALVLVCSRDGGFHSMAETAGAKGPLLKAGDFVAWKALEYVPQLAEGEEDERVGWFGLIVGTLRPEWRQGSWVGGERFL
jgi:hypothetical protein